MQTAMEEIGRAVQASRVYVQWTPAETGDSGPGSQAGPQDEVRDR